MGVVEEHGGQGLDGAVRHTAVDHQQRLDAQGLYVLALTNIGIRRDHAGRIAICRLEQKYLARSRSHGTQSQP